MEIRKKHLNWKYIIWKTKSENYKLRKIVPQTTLPSDPYTNEIRISYDNVASMDDFSVLRKAHCKRLSAISDARIHGNGDEECHSTLHMHRPATNRKTAKQGNERTICENTLDAFVCGCEWDQRDMHTKVMFRTERKQSIAILTLSLQIYVVHTQARASACIYQKKISHAHTFRPQEQLPNDTEIREEQKGITKSREAKKLTWNINGQKCSYIFCNFSLLQTEAERRNQVVQLKIIVEFSPCILAHLSLCLHYFGLFLCPRSVSAAHLATVAP